MNGLITTIIQQLPSIFDFIRQEHAQQHPGEPPLTDDDVKAALAAAVASSIAKDDQWLAAHPEPPA